ncbi:MAG: chemotaxis protein CheD [bacterium]
MPEGSDGIIRVGMADKNISTNGDRLVTFGLGSCVGVAIYDEVAEIAGLAHIMLPDSSSSKSPTTMPAKFADQAIRDLVEDLVRAGARRERLKAKIVGGAEMFSFTKTDNKSSIGLRNIIAVRKNLKEVGIDIVAEDVGGNYGRTIEVYPRTGKVRVRTIEHGEKEI